MRLTRRSVSIGSSITAGVLAAASVTTFVLTNGDGGHSRLAAENPPVASSPSASAIASDTPTPSPSVSVTPTVAPPVAPAPAQAAAPRATTQAKKKATAAAPPGAGGIVGAAVPGWRLTFSESFDKAAGYGAFGSAYNSRFWTYGGPDSSHVGTYDTNRVISVGNGVLDMFMHADNGQYLGAAIVPVTSNPSQTYGRYVVKFRTDHAFSGYGAAFLLWPNDNNWSEGEIDFPEAPFDARLALHDHCLNGNPSQSCYDAETAYSWTSWHTATTEWVPGQVRFYIDGTLVGQSNVSPSHPMHMVIQTGTNGTAPNPASQGHLLIDSIAIYAMA